MHDLQVSRASVTRPRWLRAGFHATADDRSGSGLLHAGEQWAPARFLIRRHTHPVWELYLQVHGLTRWSADGRVWTVQPGHLLAVAPGVAHQMVEEPGANTHFYFAAVDLTTVLTRRCALAGAWRAAPPALHRADAGALAEPFAQLIRELTTRHAYPDAGLALAVDHLVLTATRRLTDIDPAPELAVHPAVTRTRELLDRHYPEPLSLAVLADRVGLAPTYLGALFAAHVGISPHRYLVERRLDRARQLLATSDLPITTIALEVGFGSGQHFARAFRRDVGVTPREYRTGRRAR